MIANRISRNILAASLLLPIIFTGCGIQADDMEQSSFYAADDNGNEESIENILPMKQENFADNSDNEISDVFTGETVAQVIESTDGRTISIDAQVYADGIDRVSCYRYVPEPFTEELRESLLKKMHPAETWDVMDAAVYNPENNAWEFVTPTGRTWSYQIIQSEIPKEEILNHEDTAANISSDIKQIYPVIIQKDEADDLRLLLEVTETVPSEIEQIGLYDIGVIDKNGEYSCSFLQVCETYEGEFYAKAVFRKIIDGMPVTTWHDFSTATTKDSPFPVKVWGSLFSEEEIGLDKPILTVDEAVTAIQEQADLIPVQDKELAITKISLEYLSVIDSDGELLIVPIWRFWTGNEAEWNLMGEEVLAVNAISGEFILESRKTFTE
ncbi:MAG: hypothetical protein HDR00_02000 [Lachnospiraceae bacterium]|nr:hypothetical protein [Lachnospiraceae bacterium]